MLGKLPRPRIRAKTEPVAMDDASPLSSPTKPAHSLIGSSLRFKTNRGLTTHKSHSSTSLPSTTTDRDSIYESTRRKGMRSSSNLLAVGRTTPVRSTPTPTRQMTGRTTPFSGRSTPNSDSVHRSSAENKLTGRTTPMGRTTPTASTGRTTPSTLHVRKGQSITPPTRSTHRRTNSNGSSTSINSPPVQQAPLHEKTQPARTLKSTTNGKSPLVRERRLKASNTPSPATKDMNKTAIPTIQRNHYPTHTFNSSHIVTKDVSELKGKTLEWLQQRKMEIEKEIRMMEQKLGVPPDPVTPPPPELVDDWDEWEQSIRTHSVQWSEDELQDDAYQAMHDFIDKELHASQHNEGTLVTGIDAYPTSGNEEHWNVLIKKWQQWMHQELERVDLMAAFFWQRCPRMLEGEPIRTEGGLWVAGIPRVPEKVYRDMMH